MTAIVSGGVLETGFGFGYSSEYFGLSVQSSLGGYMTSQEYATLYRTQANVRLVVDFLARNIGQVSLHFFRRMSDTDRVRLMGEGVAAVLEQPNPYTTPYRLISGLVADLAIFGVGYWAKVGDATTPGLARLQPWRVFPRGYDTGAPVAFWFVGNDGSRVSFDPSRVVYFRFYNPQSERVGLSPLESLRQTLAVEAAAETDRLRFWTEGAKVSGFIERPKDAPKWSPDARERFRQDWRSRYTGAGQEVGGTPILEDGMTFNDAAFSSRDSQYLEARKLAREEVAAAYYIPPPMVGILDNANYSNTKAFHQQLYQDTLGPWFELIAQEVELQLIPDFDSSGQVYAEFNVADKLKGSFEEQAAALSLATGGPWMTRAEARGRMNLPDLHDPKADELITPLNVSVGGQAAPNAPQPGTASIAEVVTERATARLMDAIAASDMRRARRVLVEADTDLNGEGAA